MSIVIPYIPYILLLLLSPLIGRISLRFVYPDVKTYITLRRWLLFIVFGMVAYIPAAFLGLFELPVPMHAASYALLESETNTMYFLAMFGVFLIINSSIIEYTNAHRRVVVGVPSKVIKYSIQREKKKKQEAHKLMREKTRKDIEKITAKLEETVATSEKDKRAEKVVSMVKEHPSKAEEPEKTPKEAKAEMEYKLEEKIGGESMRDILEKKAKAKKPEEKKAEEEKKEEAKPEAKKEEGELKKIREDLEKTAMKTKAKEGGIEGILKQLKDTLRSEKRATQLERERTLKMLEEELERRKKAVEGMGPEALSEEELKVEKMLETLRGKLYEQGRLEKHIKEEEPEEFYTSSDIGDITKALRDLKKQEVETRKETKKLERERKKQEEKPETEITTSIDLYGRAHPKKKEDEILKSVVGDVRQQLLPGKEKEAEIEGAEKWYEKEEGEPLKKEQLEIPSEEGVEILESDLSFGDEDLGLGSEDELSGLGEDLEDLGESLDTEKYDGMFVDLGEIKNACPRCKKKGATIVYCTSCGKPFCSNCAASMEPQKDSINYKCPNCGAEFLMKRRNPA